jgi:hypothetical protein
MFTTDNLYARLERINAMEARDPNRFAANPRGPEFLTRRERYNELRWELRRRLRQAEQIPGCVWRDAATPFASNH